MTDRFVAIDFETANPNLASICQIGAVTFEDGVIVDEWVTLVNPKDYFYGWNVAIHGINEESVSEAPTFPEVFDSFSARTADQIVVSHSAFDRTALSQVCQKYKLTPPECLWLDSASVARRAWSDFAWKGYGLKKVCKAFGIEFNHHDALEDAGAAGKVLVRAINETSLTLDDWIKRVRKPIDINAASVKREGNRDGPLADEAIVFTGALCMPRRQAADLAAKVGCNVITTVTKKTTMLVVGDQDIDKLAGHDKSSKHRKAEELISKGQPIRILKETDFLRLVELESEASQESPHDE